MAFSFDNLVYFSSLIMFVVALICIFVYEFLSPKTSSNLTAEPKITGGLNRKGSKIKQQKQQSDKFG
jgi:hypothetical protein